MRELGRSCRNAVAGIGLDAIAGAWETTYMNDLPRAKAAAALPSIVEALPFPGFAHSGDGEILAVSDALVERTGYARSQLTDVRSWLDLSGAESPEGAARATRRVDREGSVCRSVDVRTRGGSVLRWELCTSAVDVEGATPVFLTVGVDLSDRLDAYEDELDASRRRLQRSQKLEAVGRLAGGMAHDFNNLLTVILANASFLLDSLPEGSEHDDVVSIVEAAKRAERLTNQLLAYSRRKPISPRVLNANEIVEDLREMLDSIVGETVRVVTSLAEDAGHVRCDPDAMEQILVNLAVNARDAMPEGGTLTIETRNVRLDEGHEIARQVEVEGGEYVFIAVSDTGIGIPSSIRDEIFEPFFTTKSIGEGTGLGLSTCYGLVKQVDGYIGVYSELGVGSTFKIYLPRVRSPKSGKTRGEPEEIPRGSATILLVEDETSVRRSIRRLLESLGYEVMTARDGEDALGVIEAEGDRIELIVTDVVMPRMDGPSLVRRVARTHPEMAVLFVSGYTSEAIARHGMLGEDAPLLQKPFTLRRLGVRVHEALSDDGFDAVDLVQRRPLLVVEDDATVLLLLSAELEDDYDVTVARSGAEALERLETEDFDVVLSDVVMPEMGGVELYERACELRPEMKERFVFLTVFTEQIPSVRASTGLPVASKFQGRAAILRAVAKAAARA